jgi:hypothetical protein
MKEIERREDEDVNTPAFLKLQQLLAMPIAQRFEAIINDLIARDDKFREIEEHDLAEALGVIDSRSPGSANTWCFTAYGVKRNIEEYAECNAPQSELIYLIEDKVSAERFQALVKLSSGLDQIKSPDFHFLNPGERKHLEEAIGSEELENNQANGMCCVANYTVETPSGYSLSFEGDVEDDGKCITLRTPYDYRDGKLAVGIKSQRKDWTGQRFGRLVAVSFVGRRRHNAV